MKSADENSSVAADAVEEIITMDNEVAFDEEITYDFEVSANYEVNKSLINQKLQDLYDLLALQNQHPEFTEDVTEQLKNYTNQSNFGIKTDDVVIIKNLRQLDNLIILNDSIQKVKIKFDKISNNKKETDTIYAIISSKNVIVDGESLISNKILFSKN